MTPMETTQRLTARLATRRINLALPAESLLLTKAVGKVPHTGGTRFKEDSHLYATIMRWLEAAAPQDPPTVPTPVSVELCRRRWCWRAGREAADDLRAHYSDGTDRDVTPWRCSSATTTRRQRSPRTALVTAGTRGEAYVMARFATFTVGSQAIVHSQRRALSMAGRGGEQLTSTRW